MPLKVMMNLARLVHARRGDIARALAEDSKRSVWAVADQGIVSIGNFAVNIVLYRAFQRIGAVGQYGDFWTLMELMLFINGVQTALVIYPLTVRAATTEPSVHGRLAGMSMLLTMLAWPIAGLAVLLVAYTARIPLQVGLWAGVAMLLWQVQETTRRTLLARFRFRQALIGDSVSYLGQVAAIIALAMMGRLTLLATFQAMAITSAVAALLQSAQIRLHAFGKRELNDFTNECWSLGRWAVAGSATGVISPIYAWNMRYWLGDELLGISYALTNLLRLSNPLCSVMASMITPHAARDLHEKGLHRAKIQFLRFLGLGLLLLTPYLGLLIFLPRFSLAMMYTWNSICLNWPGPLVLQISAISSGLIFLVIVSGAFLNGVKQPRLGFIGQFASMAVYLVVGMPLTARMGLIGAALGGMIASLVQCLINAYCVISLSGPRGDEPSIAPQVQSAAV